MKKSISYLLVTASSLLLSSCATLSPQVTPPDSLHQQLGAAAAKKLDASLNTAKDGTTTTWQNDGEDTQYQLTLGETYVNAKGQPCRHYELRIHRDYHRKLVTQAVTCRDDEGQWRLDH